MRLYAIGDLQLGGYLVVRLARSHAAGLLLVVRDREVEDGTVVS